MRPGALSEPTLAPLFDRLAEWGPEEEGAPGPTWMLDEPRLRASVRHEVAHILGTRSRLTLEQEAALGPAGRSSVDYGMPDVGTLSLESSLGARHLERLIARAVEAFEPRLEHIQVTVHGPTGQSALPVAVLTARLTRAPADTLSLPLRLDRSGRLMEVEDGDEHPEG